MSIRDLSKPLEDLSKPLEDLSKPPEDLSKPLEDSQIRSPKAHFAVFSVISGVPLPGAA
jgi:hypothetical protein